MQAPSRLLTTIDRNPGWQRGEAPWSARRVRNVRAYGSSFKYQLCTRPAILPYSDEAEASHNAAYQTASPDKSCAESIHMGVKTQPQISRSACKAGRPDRLACIHLQLPTHDL